MRNVRMVVVGIVVLAGLGTVGAVRSATPAAASCANPQSGVYVGSFTGSNGASTASGSAQYDITFSGSSFSAVVTYVSGRTILVPGSTGSGTFNCDTFTGGATVGGDVVNFSGSALADGTFSGPWSDSFGYVGSFAVAPVGTTVSDPSATTLATGGTPSPTDPVQAEVDSPTAGPLSLSTAQVSGLALPGYSMFGLAVDISAPPASDAAPLTLTLSLDPSVLNAADPSTVQVFENGSPAAQWCGAAAPPIDAATDPCEVDPPTVDPVTGVVTITVLTTQASIWTFGVTAGLTITTPSLPRATPGVAYGPVTLHETGAPTSTSPHVTTFKWKKVTLPKGLKLSPAGVLSGTPKLSLPVPPSATVQVTATVTTLNAKGKPVRTRLVATTLLPFAP